MLSCAQGRALYPQTGSPLRTVGVFLQTSCFGLDRHLASCKAPLGSFQLRASCFEALVKDLARTCGICGAGEQDRGQGGKILGAGPRASLDRICFCLPQTTESVIGKKDRHLSYLESEIQKHKAEPHLFGALGIWRSRWPIWAMGGNVSSRPSNS